MDRHEQLARIQGELADASRRAHEIAARLENEQWRTRPAGDQWSVAECLIHLNMTSQAFLPLIRDLLGKGRNQQVFRSTSAWMDFVGRLLWLAVTVRLPIKTTEPFVPARVQPKDTVLSEFDGFQNQVIDCLSAAEELDLGTLRIVSPFDSRIKYNLYSCLRIIPAHQRPRRTSREDPRLERIEVSRPPNHEVRAGHQHEDRENARADDSQSILAPSRRNHSPMRTVLRVKPSGA